MEDGQARVDALKLVDDLKGLRDSEAADTIMAFMQDRGLLLPKTVDVAPADLDRIYGMAVRHFVDAPTGAILSNRGFDHRHINTLCLLRAAITYLTGIGALHRRVTVLAKGARYEVAG